MQMKILYRISDGGNNKGKPTFVYDKKRMFLHFLKIFQKHDIYIFADNVSNQLFQFILSNYTRERIERIYLGNSKSFLYTVDFAIRHFAKDEVVYFAEDDYIYCENAPEIIREGIDIADYSSGYDHPDKYQNAVDGGNPLVEHGGEITRVVLTAHSHWKFTNSCCMTFATKVGTIENDYDIFRDGSRENNPQDFHIFCRLLNERNRKVGSCIPAVSTHGESLWLSPFIQWNKVFRESFY